jgi:hypothetical protein
VATAALLFTGQALNTGEFNYQGGDVGDRKSFTVGRFPFDGGQPDAWTTAGADKVTNDSDSDSVFKDGWYRFGYNVEYFLVGRHFGFVPYFFPGAFIVFLWLFSAERRVPWRLYTFLAVVASAIALLVFAPFTWSGGGGPPGNRYFMSVYAAMIFLTPPLGSFLPALVAWAGGALFTAKMVLNPFVAAKHPNETTERGFARQLPVELTMANDLPIMLEGIRAHSWFNDVLMYFLDEHAHNPEKIDADGTMGVWISGDGRADILIRSDWPIDHLRITADSPVATTFIVSMGAGQQRIPLEPRKPVTFDLQASGVRDYNATDQHPSNAYLFSARSTAGFTPHLMDPANDDPRNLGVRMQFKAFPKQ